jgi:hypothetical protein
MPNDAVVNSKDVLGSLMELRRVGHPSAMQQLEELEPELMEYCLEQVSRIHKQLLDCGLRPTRVRRLVRATEELALVLVMSLRAAHLRLWQDQHAPDGATSPIEEGPGDESGGGDSSPSHSALPESDDQSDEEEQRG